MKESGLRRLISLLGICLLASSSVWAQQQDGESIDIYGLGDQTFSISAGMMLPLFFLGSDGSFDPMNGHVKIGATGSLRWAGFVNNELSIGAELGGMFAPTVLGRTLISIPIVGFVSHTIRFFPFELALHPGLGVNFLRLDSDLYIGPILKPGFSIYWNFNSEWAFGLRSEYWFVPEWYFGDSPPASESTFGNFLTVTLSTLYHF